LLKEILEREKEENRLLKDNNRLLKEILEREKEENRLLKERIEWQINRK